MYVEVPDVILMMEIDSTLVTTDTVNLLGAPVLLMPRNHPKKELIHYVFYLENVTITGE